MMAWHGRKPAVPARRASRITSSRLHPALCSTTALAGGGGGGGVMPYKADKHVDKAVALVRCAPREARATRHTRTARAHPHRSRSPVL